MTSNLLLLILCYIIMISFLFFLPRYTKKILTTAGKQLLSFNKKTDVKYYGVLIFAFLLVFLMYLQKTNL